MNKLKILFMGTPEFAVATLRAIHQSHHQVVGVVTVPDKPAGRGKKIQFSEVKNYALEQNLPLFQPEKLKNPQFIQALESLQADVFVVVAFRMLPKEIWTIPKKGTFNLHASLLPQYRGAAPINWAIINGEKTTGNTTFFIDEAIDTGQIILQETLKIDPTDNAGIVHDRLMENGAKLVIATLDLIATGEVKTKPQVRLIQPDQTLKSAPKIFKEDCRVDWNWETERIQNFIRGLSPYPAAFSEMMIGNETKIKVKIYKSKVNMTFDKDQKNGEISSDGKSYLNVKCSNGSISLEEMQIEGKKKLGIVEFLNGFRGIEGLKFQ